MDDEESELAMKGRDDNRQSRLEASVGPMSVDRDFLVYSGAHAQR